MRSITQYQPNVFHASRYAILGNDDATMTTMHNNNQPVSIGNVLLSTGAASTAYKNFTGTIKEVYIKKGIATTAQMNLT